MGVYSLMFVQSPCVPNSLHCCCSLCLCHAGQLLAAWSHHHPATCLQNLKDESGSCRLCIASFGALRCYARPFFCPCSMWIQSTKMLAEAPVLRQWAKTGSPDRACLHCRIEFLTHDISVHVPHHVSSKIPWYNLRLAHNSLQQNWGQVSFLLLLHPPPPSAPLASLLPT